jgi:chemotaxis protein CheX
MSLSIDLLVQVVDDVMESFVGVLGEPLEPYATDELPVGASVQVSGTWTGSVLVSCSEALAAHAAASMFETSIDELGPDDIGDALGEIANMIGGSVKSLMPEPSALSLPVVTFGSTRSVVPGARLVQELHRVCGSEPFHVSVLAPAA